MSGYAADSLPFIVAWLFAAWRTRRFVPTWLIGVVAGVVIRAIVLSHYRWGELSFLVVALAFIGGAAFLVWIALTRVGRSSP